MKKLLFLFVSLTAIAFTACNPLDDTYSQLDKASEGYQKKGVTVTLTEAQYKSLKGKPGVNSYVNNDFYFVSEAEAGALIPTVLSSAFPAVDNGSSVTVNYNSLLFNFKGANKVTSTSSYTVSSSDYSSNGFRFGNLSTYNDVVKILNYVYPNAVEYDQVLLTYKQYDSSVASSAFIVTRAYYLLNGAWQTTYLVSNEDYVSVDRGRFNNFTVGDIPNLASYFNNFLKKTPTIIPIKGDIKLVSYLIYSGTAKQSIMAIYYDGLDWKEVTKPVTEVRSLSFLKDKGVWVPDLTIFYTLKTSDYSDIAGNTSLGNTANRANLAQYGNFSHRSLTDATYWSDDQINASISYILKKTFPNAKVGQKIEVTYIQYTGSTGPATRKFQLQASGTYAAI